MFVTKTRDSIALLEHRTLLDLVRMDLTSRLLQSCLQPQNAPTLSSYSSDNKENVPSLFEPVLNKRRVEPSQNNSCRMTLLRLVASATRIVSLLYSITHS